MKGLVALAVVVTAGHAAAYEIKTDGQGHPVHWSQGKVTYWIDAAGARDVPLPAAEQAVRAAFGAWDLAPGVAFDAEYAGRVEGETPGYRRDEPGRNRNVVIWSRDDWAFEPGALAITVSVFKVGSGELVDADIVVNERQYAWGVGAEAENDLQNTLTHEVGHFIGLGHSTVAESTMYASAAPYETHKRDLHADDIAGAATLYPGEPSADDPGEATAPSEVAEIHGGPYRNDAVSAPPRAGRGSGTTPAPPALGCSAAPAGGASGSLAALALLAAMMGPARRRRARRGAEGGAR